MTKVKYDEILECLKQCDTADKKIRKEQWSQGHAWNSKYALFDAGDAVTLIFNTDAGVKEKAGVGGKAGAGAVGGAAVPGGAAFDMTVLVSHGEEGGERAVPAAAACVPPSRGEMDSIGGQTEARAVLVTGYA